MVTRVGEARGRRDFVQLVAVQMRLSLKDYWTRRAFAVKIDEMMREVASKCDAHSPILVVFPEDVGLMLVAQGMERTLAASTSIEDAIRRAVRTNFRSAAWGRLRNRLSWVPALFFARHRRIATTYFDVFAHVAAQYGVYVVAGSVVLPPYDIDDVRRGRFRPTERRVYNVSYLFGPQGDVLGAQKKTNLIPLEAAEALDLAAGRVDELRAIDTPIGRIGIAICLDAFQEDVVERLRSERTDILVMPSANPGPWTEWQQGDWLRGAQRAVGETRAFRYGVNAMMIGTLFEVGFSGQSSILSRDAGLAAEAGYEATGPMTGFVRVAASAEREEVLVARVPRP